MSERIWGMYLWGVLSGGIAAWLFALYFLGHNEPRKSVVAVSYNGAQCGYHVSTIPPEVSHD